MILTTTNTIEGFKIADYLGIVTGVAINNQTLASGFSTSKYYKKFKRVLILLRKEHFKIYKKTLIS